MMYDSIRIQGLMITSLINKTLIKLHLSPDATELRQTLVHLLVCYCHNSMQLKPGDQHLTANVRHLQYTL